MNYKNLCPSAIAYIRGEKNSSQLCGQVKFYGFSHCVVVEASVKGLPQSETGFFGFHIHEGKDCGGNSFSDTKGHYNPKNTPHPNHAGDLPPLLLCNGGAYMSFSTDRFCVKDIIGRTICGWIFIG